MAEGMIQPHPIPTQVQISPVPEVDAVALAFATATGQAVFFLAADDVEAVANALMAAKVQLSGLSLPPQSRLITP